MKDAENEKVKAVEGKLSVEVSLWELEGKLEEAQKNLLCKEKRIEEIIDTNSKEKNDLQAQVS